MATLQIKIDDKDLLAKLKEMAKLRGLSMTTFVRMLVYERINSSLIELEEEIGKRRVGKECRSRWSPYH